MAWSRKYPRYNVVDMGVSARTIVDETVELLDISIGGASVRSSRRFLIGSEYFFTFDLNQRIVSMKGTIVWEKLTGAEQISEGEAIPWYTVGVESTDALTDSSSELRKFLAEKLKERRLSGVRIKLHTTGGTPLSCLEACVVRDLSMGGMQIATDLKPPLETVLSFDLILRPNESSIHGKGRVTYCLEATEDIPHRCCAGVEFLDMCDEDKVKFRRFLVVLWLNPPKFLEISPMDN